MFMKKIKNTSTLSKGRELTEATSDLTPSPATRSDPDRQNQAVQSQPSRRSITGLRVLYCTAEAQPLVKTGGLGEVSGALPPALGKLGVDMRLLIPAYRGVIDTIQGKPLGKPFKVLPGVEEPVQLFQGTLPDGQAVYAIACPPRYDREGGPYSNVDGDEWPDNALRFGILSKVAALFGSAAGLVGWMADIIHCNDWHTGLAPAYLVYDRRARARSLISIHNIAFQGNCSPELLPALGLPKSCFVPDGVEFYGQISFLKAGLYYADYLTTVSPRYAREIQTAERGFGMEGLLAYRRNRLTGILNGIDTTRWDPQQDSYLTARFGPQNLVGKAVNKQLLQERLGLKASAETVVLGMISRFTYQKGVDLTLGIAEELLEQQPVQLVVLGSGERHYEIDWGRLAWDYPGRVSVTVGYDVALAHLIEAGADIFLMPSRSEPCGLNQMYSMRYGTPPVVRRTGGLADSVVDTTPRTLTEGTATGFVFENANHQELLACVLRALLAYQDKKTWQKIQNNGMLKEFGWETSAAKYLKIYQALAPDKRISQDSI
jgi:starch synthase